MAQNAKPVFLLAGGRHSRGKRPDPLLQAVFQEYGIKSPTVAYSGTASGDDRRFFSFIAREIKEAGAGKVVHAVIAPEGADLKKAKAYTGISRYRLYQRRRCGSRHGDITGKEDD